MINVQYLMDEKGNKTAVQIPINDWVDISENLKEIIAYITFKKNINTAFEEAKDMENGKIPSISLKEFLNEL